jgi:hypothetical protein
MQIVGCREKEARNMYPRRLKSVKRNGCPRAGVGKAVVLSVIIVCTIYEVREERRD